MCLSAFAKTLLNMVYPPQCGLCRRFVVNESPALNALTFPNTTAPSPLLQITTPNLCRECLSAFMVLPHNVCPQCGCVPENGRCLHCLTHPLQHARRSVSLMYYNEHLGRVIKGFKYQGHLHYGVFLSLSLLAGLAIFAHSDIIYDMVVPVPLHPKKQKARRFNQNERLLKLWRPEWLRHIPQLAGTLIKTDLLERRKHTRSQAGLDMSARMDNVADAFAVKPAFKLMGKTVLLVDDIVTTGATTDNCALALKQGGALYVDIISAARTMPHLNPDHLLEI